MPPKAANKGSKSQSDDADATSAALSSPPATSDASVGYTGGGATLSPRPYVLIIPQEDDRFMINESQLTTLAEGGSDKSLELALFAAGAAVGLLPSFGSTVALLRTGVVPSPLNLGLAVVFLCLAVSALLTWFYHRNNRSRITKVVDKVRSGQKLQVGKEEHTS